MRATMLLCAAGLAAAFAAVSGPVRAQSFMPGDAPTRAGNLVGGGGATISGGGDDMVITYSAGGAGGGGGVFAQDGWVARFRGNDGDGPQVDYTAPVPPAVPGAGSGREAWIVGGGDNAEVVYSRPR